MRSYVTLTILTKMVDCLGHIICDVCQRSATTTTEEKNLVIEMHFHFKQVFVSLLFSQSNALESWTYHITHRINASKCVRNVDSCLMVVFPTLWQCGQGCKCIGNIPILDWSGRIAATAFNLMKIIFNWHLK